MPIEQTIIILTGVAGSGKTTIGEALARRLGWPFYDADDLHPAQNIVKMAQGEPLDDADRAPWLQRLHNLLVDLQSEDRPAVLACSALKKSYRQGLAQGLDDICFVFLDGDPELILARLQARQNHYMAPTMFQSQLEALEPPSSDEAIHVDVSGSVEEIVSRILAALPDCPGSSD